MTFTFKKATKSQSRLRMALIGPSGSGKTYSALSIGTHLDSPIAVIDTERGSASKYSGLFEFDVLELESFSPQNYVEAIRAAEAAGYKTLIIDSLSHAWNGQGGALELVDKAAKRSGGSNSFGAWRDVTPLHNAMVDAILGARMHIIVTIRAKTEYVQERNEKTGKTQVRKVGMAPVQRDGLEYEFDVVADLDQDNNFIVSKTRCPELSEGVFHRAGENVSTILTAWLSDGVELVSRELWEECEAAREDAIARGFRSPNKKLPAPLPWGCLASEAQKRLDGYKKWLEENPYDADPPESPVSEEELQAEADARDVSAQEDAAGQYAEDIAALFVADGDPATRNTAFAN